MDFEGKLTELRNYFKLGKTKKYDFRKIQLVALQKAIETHETEIYQALYTDLNKSKEECWITENGFVLGELKHTIKKLKSWMRPEKVYTNLVNLPGRSRVYNEPFGVVLIISPWNYPLNLLFTPLIGAIASGNCVVLKPSEFAPAISGVMKKIIESVFPENYILYVEGDGKEVIPAMMNNTRFDHIFYTGSTAVGKIIYEAAAKKLTPVTLELGGKSPCVVEADADIEVAAKRICFAKFTNAGQTCVAPDYILVHQDVKNKLSEELKKNIEIFFKNPDADGYDYGKIINKQQFQRLNKYISESKVLYGGEVNEEKLLISPTLLEDVNLQEQVMNEEIFGPILPIIAFSDTQNAYDIIARNPNPLAFYVFTNDNKKADQWIDAVPSGGACVNNASVHLINHNLPFGGRGNSGMGKYHGQFSFHTFSHQKAVMKSATWFDPAIKYPPYKGKLNLLKKIIG